MVNTLTKVTLIAGLLLLAAPRGAAAQGCQTIQQRLIRYDTVSPGAMVGSSLCRFTARVIDQTIQACPGSAALMLAEQESDYPIDILAEGGNALCAQYKPLYTAWCHGGNAPDATTPGNVTASMLPGGQVALAWRDNSGHCRCEGEYCPASPQPAWQTFDIWRRTNLEGYSWIASVDGTTTSYLDAAVPPGQQAFYSVGARHPAYRFSVISEEAAATLAFVAAQLSAVTLD